MQRADPYRVKKWSGVGKINSARPPERIDKEEALAQCNDFARPPRPLVQCWAQGHIEWIGAGKINSVFCSQGVLAADNIEAGGVGEACLEVCLFALASQAWTRHIHLKHCLFFQHREKCSLTWQGTQIPRFGVTLAGTCWFALRHAGALLMPRAAPDAPVGPAWLGLGPAVQAAL